MREVERSSRHTGQSARLIAILCLAACGGGGMLAGCGGASDSEVKSDAGTGGTGGANGTGGHGSGGTTATGGAIGTGGATGTGGTGGGAGSSGSGGGGAGCAARAMFTEASHQVLSVTWPAGTATTAGSGQVHVWGKTLFTAEGNKLSGSLQACGTVLPPAGLAALVGGGMMLIEIPPASWDAPGAARFPMEATQSDWTVGSTLNYGYTALVGFTFPNPGTAPWPASYTGITMPTDADGDMEPGLTAVPRNSGGYVLPPTSALGALGIGSRADKVSLVIRNVATMDVTRSSCDEAVGTATFTHFDYHVIGCHVSGGSACSAAEVKFIDDNRTLYAVTAATAKTKVVANGATCADVRAALPM